MLERVVGREAPISPKELAGHLGMPLSNVSYHARVLVECDVFDLVDTKPRRGSIEHFYEPSGLVEHPMVRAALGLEGDEHSGTTDG
jgi:hypothetical protein